ncbi:hypothetical protein D3C77_624920 [compost metagenome]
MLAQLQHQVVALRAIQLVWRRDERRSVFDERLELRHEIGARVAEPVQRQRSLAIEEAKRVLYGLGWCLVRPLVVVGIVVVRRDGHGCTGFLEGREKPPQVRDQALLGNALAEDRPARTL